MTVHVEAEAVGFPSHSERNSVMSAYESADKRSDTLNTHISIYIRNIR